MVGLPATIDNDVAGTDTTIGFDTAVNTALDAIDKIRDTAVSYERIFVVEVMGRTRGFLALDIGFTSGAGVILVPEIKYDLDAVCEDVREYERKGKATTIIVAAEGIGDTSEVAKFIEKCTDYEVRWSKLGYIQRGGAPTARSRMLASMFGVKAVDLLLNGDKNKMVGLRGGDIISVDLEYACNTVKPLDEGLFKLAKELAI